MNRAQPARTIVVTYRSRSRLARLRLRHPATAQPGRNRLPARHPAYDADTAMELIANTCELPTTKRDLLIVLAHYRHALHALAAQALAGRQADRI